jgi:hypothetical protein
MSGKYKWIRFLLLLILGLLGLALGYLRWTYTIYWANGFKIIERYKISNFYKYPSDFSSLLLSIKQDPRWLSFIIYSISPLFISIFVIYLSFLKKEYVYKTIVVYLSLWSLVIFISALSLFFPSYEIGIGLAQNIKNLVQMPFTTLLILAGFKVNEIMQS